MTQNPIKGLAKSVVTLTGFIKSIFTSNSQRDTYLKLVEQFQSDIKSAEKRVDKLMAEINKQEEQKLVMEHDLKMIILDQGNLDYVILHASQMHVENETSMPSNTNIEIDLVNAVVNFHI